MSNAQNDPPADLRRLWKCSRTDGYGCHAPGGHKGREPAKKTPPTEGSKSQKRKKNYANHTPFTG